MFKSIAHSTVTLFTLSLVALALAGCEFRATDQAVIVNPEQSASIFTRVYDGLTGDEANYGELIFAITTEPNLGTLSGTLPNVVYEPNIDFLAGNDTFNYSATKENIKSNASVYITITERFVSRLEINDAFIFDGQAVGNLIYLAAGQGGLKIVDILNPITPTVIGSYDPFGALISAITNLAVSNNIAFVMDASQGVLALDVTVPQAPTLVSQFGISGGGVAVVEDVDPDPQLDRTYVYTVNTTEGLYVLDGKTGGTPGELELIANFPSITGVDIHIIGNTAFVNTGIGIIKLDITDRSNPTVTTTTAEGEGYLFIALTDLIPLDENRVYFTGTIIDTIDLSSISVGLMDFTNPSFTIPQQSNGVALGFSISISQDTTSGLTQAFVLDKSATLVGSKAIPSIQVMDVTDTTPGVNWLVSEQIITPGIQTTPPPFPVFNPAPWHSFAADGGLIIVADGSRGITILDGN